MQADSWIYRHAAIVRVTHWINLLCLTILLMSGLQIFNPHPALYLGEQSSFDRPVLSMTAEFHANGFAGITTILEQRLITTGILGVSKLHGEDVERAFPSWATVPSGQDTALLRGTFDETCFLHFPVFAGSAARSSITSGCDSPKATKPVITMCSSSSPILSSYSSCCR